MPALLSPSTHALGSCDLAHEQRLIVVDSCSTLMRDGQRERVELPDPSVRIMTARVTSCSCKDSPAETPGCFRGPGGSKKLPRPWEATPQ